MPVQYGPLRISQAKATEIMERVIDERTKTLYSRAMEVFPDGLLLGMKKIPPRQRFAQYLLQTQDPTDFLRVEDPDYLEKYNSGEISAPTSPFWLNVLSIPDLWLEITKDFRHLKQEYAPDVNG